MGSIASVSQSQLTRRRRLLRHQRRRKFFQAGWQMLAVSALAGGLLWASTLPIWVIHEPEQIVILGNQFLSAKAIRALLPLSYPQSLLQVRPKLLSQELESQAPIAQATVIRQIFPPALTVEVRERYPVAIAQMASSVNHSVASTQQTPAPAKTMVMGLLDENGVWMPLESYTSLQQTMQLPTLKVTGDPIHYRPYWPKVYQAISRSPIKVYELDWLDPNNLILKTELGIVHCGADTSQFSYQLEILDRMRELPKHLNINQVSFIDLKNPENPMVKMISVSRKK